MIPFKEAHNLVLAHHQDFGTVKVPLKEAIGRVLAEDVCADRDFPPFDRATKDGIVINFEAFEKGREDFEVVGTLAAGEPIQVLEEKDTCMEIMTGAVVPYDADTVIMYEHIDIQHGIAHLNAIPVKGQNIHWRGSDRMKGDVVVSRDRKIASADIGILASVGYTEVCVKRMPSIAVISTGDELVEINETPLPHQIRKSNAYQLFASLSSAGIQPLLLHVADDKDMIRQKLSYAIQEMDVLVLSGGVSRGKFDFIPDIMEELGVETVFHKVMQRPGKPFWFGNKKDSRTLIFSFPGNPVSTFVCYHRYFRDWLRACLGLPVSEIYVLLNEEIPALAGLTQFIGVRTSWDRGRLLATTVKDNGSGDFMALARTDGFICLEPRERPYEKGEAVAFVATRKIM